MPVSFNKGIPGRIFERSWGSKVESTIEGSVGIAAQAAGFEIWSRWRPRSARSTIGATIVLRRDIVKSAHTVQNVQISVQPYVLSKQPCSRVFNLLNAEAQYF